MAPGVVCKQWKGLAAASHRERSGALPGYNIVRMDLKQHKETGSVIYIHGSLTFKRLHHLEQHAVESVWI